MLLHGMTQQAEAAPTWQGVITLALFLAGFGYLGWRRGSRREFVALLGIILGHRVWTTELGERFVLWVNQWYIMMKIGIEARFDPIKMAELSANIGQIKPLITPERQDAFLFFTFLALVMLGYALGQTSFAEAPHSLVGALMGMVNGYLLVLWLFPTLFAVLPSAPPGRSAAARVAGGASTRDVLAQGIRELAAVFGLEAGQLLLLVVGGLVLWVAWRSR